MKIVWKIVTGFLLTLGVLALLMILVAFTSVPFWIWYGLGTSRAGITGSPDYIVVLGGAGIPSETGLMRTFYAAKAAAHFPYARLIIALPGDTADSLSSINKMRDELILRGVQPERIMLEDSGTNTRAQAIRVKEKITNYELNIKNSDSSSFFPLPSSLVLRPSSLVLRPSSHVLLVSSPEHLYRAVLSFRKVGFEQVYGLPAFGVDNEADISFTARKLGGRPWVPDVGDSITLRYQFWTQLQYEILIFREGVAIAYYWAMGWI
ncbi:MAG: YdcF family protein [bacterium]